MEFIYQSPTIGKITEAMLKVQASVETMYKEGKTNAAEKRFSCVKLEVMLEEIKPKCDAACVFLKPDIVFDGANEWLRLTVIEKESSEFFSTYAFLYPIEEKSSTNQQDLGKVITYQFRSLMRVFFAIPTADEDFDQPSNNSYNSKPSYQQTSKPPQQQQAVKPATSNSAGLSLQHQNDLMKILHDDKGMIAAICNIYGAESLSKIPDNTFETVKKACEKLAEK